ncbi:MAG: hypothetical protein H6527_06750 [Actinobacteria bacterium]|nr:hypothetical protein [Actinomycetota bacterium]
MKRSSAGRLDIEADGVLRAIRGVAASESPGDVRSLALADAEFGGGW